MKILDVKIICVEGQKYAEIKNSLSLTGFFNNLHMTLI